MLNLINRLDTQEHNCLFVFSGDLDERTLPTAMHDKKDGEIQVLKDARQEKQRELIAHPVGARSRKRRLPFSVYQFGH
jgi:hypothetical protein